ncbi:MAG: hypothetical protein JO091_10105, partial [Acidobacteriaceae bacterium]|nr:hypothetical protein [Acidobacteriaceae bacterium]
MSLFSRFLLISTFALAGIPRVLLGQQWPAPTTFGSVAVGSSSQQTVTFNNVPAGTSFSVYTGTDFTIGSPNCVGSTCTVQTTFQPHYPGLRQGAITASNQNQLYAVAFLSGIGTAPQIALGPGVISSVASPATYQLSSATLNGVVVADGGYVFVSDSANDIVYAIRTTDGRVLAIAGRGGAGYSGDGASAVNAQLNAPSALALDALGDLYIADTGNNVIRKVDGFSGNISTVAGSGVAGNGGDGGAANQAQLNGPQGLAVDAQGNLYISDTGNNRVREVLANNGQITGSNTIVAKAGTGVAGFSGDGGPAVSAKLNQPRGIALDANGNLFIADLGNAVIREETPISGNAIFTVAGTGQSTGWSPDGTSATSALLDNPIAVAVDAAGDIYIADENNQLVREVTNDAGRPIYTIAGSVFSSGYAGDGGLATSAKLAAPSVVALDSTGNVFVVDFANRALREISARS